MGKKRGKGEYNDFLDGEKLRDNTTIRNTLPGPAAPAGDTSSSRAQRESTGKSSINNGKAGPKKPQLTHFLCLPLVNDEDRSLLETALGSLRKELESEGLPAPVVRPVGTLHLTLGVMSLDQDRLDAAKNYLQSIDLRSVLRNAAQRQKDTERTAPFEEHAQAHVPVTESPDFLPLSISLEALVPMQQPHKTSILYAEPRDSSSRLYSFASTLKDRFTNEGLMVEENRALKLHATILNTIYAKPSGRHGNAKGWMRFDATNLIGKYKDFVWAGIVPIDRVQICKMGATKIKDEDGNIVDEKYEVVAERLI